MIRNLIDFDANKIYKVIYNIVAILDLIIKELLHLVITFIYIIFNINKIVYYIGIIIYKNIIIIEILINLLNSFLEMF